MNDENPKPSDASLIDDQAAQWLVRRDRGLTAPEQDEYLQWLRENPSHAARIARHERTLQQMMRLAEWQPTQSSDPNPDLFAPRRRWRRPAKLIAAAAALAIFCGGALWWNGARQASMAIAHKSYLRVNERQNLPDGTTAELKEGSRVIAAFTPVERRVQLVGEAHFNVAKNPAWPFVVEAKGVTVRAVGTAFNVRTTDDVVEVLVTEGKVHVVPAQPLAIPDTPGRAADAAFDLTIGQRAVVATRTAAVAQVDDVTPAAMKNALEWREPRLQFFETPLSVAIDEFNRHGSTRLVLDQPELGSLLIGGTFRVSNVDGFVRVLEITLDIRSAVRGEEIVLTRAR